jgi:predicted signal transduction protein with EAL and GGDEF domain
VLAAVSAAMRDLLRDRDLCGRFGGEEFALLLPRTAAAQALEITERIRHGVSQLAIPRDGTAAIRVTISVGIAVPDRARRTLDDLIAAADHALYQAKHNGRDRVVIYADTRFRRPADRCRYRAPASCWVKWSGVRVVRRERWTSFTVNAGCWHARAMSILATLTLAPGCSP